MSRLLLILALLAAVPASVSAQATPAPASRQPRHDMRALMQQQVAMHKQLRVNVLNALTPANRNLLASLVGQLAISANPDPQATIKQLDAALSSGERTAIVGAMQSFMSQQRAAFESRMAQFRQAHPGMPSPRPMPSRAARTPDAGQLLFMMATDFGGRGPMGHGFMMRRGFGPPGFMRP